MNIDPREREIIRDSLRWAMRWGFLLGVGFTTIFLVIVIAVTKLMMP